MKWVDILFDATSPNVWTCANIDKIEFVQVMPYALFLTLLCSDKNYLFWSLVLPLCGVIIIKIPYFGHWIANELVLEYYYLLEKILLGGTNEEINMIKNNDFL